MDPFCGPIIPQIFSKMHDLTYKIFKIFRGNTPGPFTGGGGSVRRPPMLNTNRCPWTQLTCMSNHSCIVSGKCTPPADIYSSYGDCVEDKREDCQNFSVLYCVPQLYSVICTLIWAVLTGELGHVGKAYLYSAFNETSPQGAQVWITQGCPCKLHHTWFYLANVRQMAPPEWQTYNSSSLLIYRPQKDERLSWPSWLTYSGRYTPISGHTSAADRAEGRESSPIRDRRSNHWATQTTCCA